MKLGLSLNTLLASLVKFEKLINGVESAKIARKPNVPLPAYSEPDSSSGQKQLYQSGFAWQMKDS